MSRSADEKAFLASYQPNDCPRPSVAVDLVIFTIIDSQLRILLIVRKEHPFKNAWALPGGFLRVGESTTDQGEDLEDAARRALQGETGLDASRVYLEQLGAFGASGRDPRMRVVSVAYVALVRPDLAPIVKAGGDEADAQWLEVGKLPSLELAFDHAEISAKALERVRAGVESTTIAFDLVPLTFTIPELRQVHSVVLDKVVDPGNFRRKFSALIETGVIEQAPGKRITASKPATVFRFVNRA